MMTYREAQRHTELDLIELGPLIAFYWPACIRWPWLTLDAAFQTAELYRDRG